MQKMPMFVGMNDTIGERLKVAIHKSGMSQRQIDIQLGITPGSINKVVLGRNFLQFTLMIKICEILNISMDWLVWGHHTDNTDSILAKLDDAQHAGRARLEYYMAIVDELEQKEKDDVYEFLIIEADKQIRAVVNRRQQTSTLTEEVL